MAGPGSLRPSLRRHWYAIWVGAALKVMVLRQLRLRQGIESRVGFNLESARVVIN